jgi:hypothetical protein
MTPLVCKAWTYVWDLIILRVQQRLWFTMEALTSLYIELQKLSRDFLNLKSLTQIR